MALDILVTGLHDEIEKKLSVYLEEHDFIVSKIEGNNNFPILKRIFSDYYGEDEVYLNDLESLRLEVLSFEKMFDLSFPSGFSEFIANFLVIIDHSIETRRIIKIVGD